MLHYATFHTNKLFTTTVITFGFYLILPSFYKILHDRPHLHEPLKLVR